MIGRTLSHYRIVEKIGSGGMGVVYKAHDEHLGRDVAIKILPSGTLANEHARKRFRKEAVALSTLNHPNIATVHDFDTQEDLDFLVMEYVEGASLAEKVNTGPLPVKEVTELGAQIADALEEAHERGIIHRDLKPGNIAVTLKGRVKVLDFGLAKMLRPVSDEATTEALTQEQAVAGTLPYMSPEELRGERADHRSDLYSFGVVLYEMATGRRPFEHTVSTALADAIIHKPPEPPSSHNRKISPELENIIIKALAKDPEHRYQSAREMRADLERMSTPVSVVVPKRRPRQAIRWLWAGVSLAAVLVILPALNLGGLRDWLTGESTKSSIDSIAVLPLENLSGDPEQEYFADGMTDELIGQLAQIGTLKVISRTSVMQYKSARKPLPEIARELNVDAIVEGTVRRAEDRVRITAQLIEAETDQHLWAESFERELRDVLTLQSEVAQAIAQEIRVTLTPQEGEQLATTRPVDPEAYDAYLKGRFHWSALNVAGFKRAIEYFDDATRRDPDFAPPYAGRADSYANLELWGELPPGNGFSKAREAALKALAIDKTLSEAHVSLGYVKLMFEWDWAGAERELKRALELNPNSADARVRYSWFLRAMGRHDEAIAEAEKARRLGPLTPSHIFFVAVMHYHARHYDLAIEHFQEAIEMEPNKWNSYFFLAQTLTAKNALDDALRPAKKAVSLSSRGPWPLSQLGLIYGLSGKSTLAQEILAELKEKRIKRHVPARALAIVHMGLGETDQAFEWLEKAFEERVWLSHLNVWPLWDPIRDDPRFKDLVSRMNFPE